MMQTQHRRVIAAIRAGKPFCANVFVGGPPAMSLAAVLPLPEGMSELTFAGALGGRRIRLFRKLPLPPGEGWGEGSGTVLRPRPVARANLPAAASLNCTAGFPAFHRQRRAR